MAAHARPTARPQVAARAVRRVLASRSVALAIASLALAAGGTSVAAGAGCVLGAAADSARASEVLAVTRHRTFVVPSRATDRVLVFGPFQVMRYRAGWVSSRSRSRTTGSTSRFDGESRRSFGFELEEAGAPRLAVECQQQAVAQEGADPGRLRVDHELRCTLSGADGGIWALDLAGGEGTLAGTAGGRFEVRTGDALGRGRSRPPACDGFVVRERGVPVLAIARTGKGRFELAAELPAEVRRLLAAAGSALFLAELEGS